eukprot:Gb_01351 [translate_table: standard]
MFGYCVIYYKDIQLIMAKLEELIVMGKLQCFSIFVRKNKVKNDGHASVETMHNHFQYDLHEVNSSEDSVLIQIKAQECGNATNVVNEESVQSRCFDVSSDLNTYSIDIKEVVEHEGSSKVRELQNRLGPESEYQARTPVDLKKNHFKGSRSDCELSFGHEIHKLDNEFIGEFFYGSKAEGEANYVPTEPFDNGCERRMENVTSSLDAKATSNDLFSFLGDFDDHNFELNSKIGEEILSKEISIGHLSDPGVHPFSDFHLAQTSHGFQCSFSVSKSELQVDGRSPDNLSITTSGLLPSNLQSFKDLHALAGSELGIHTSQTRSQSGLTFHSSDKITLNQESLSQILPLRRQKSWWKNFLANHQDLDKGISSKEDALLNKSEEVSEALHAKEGYGSDMMDICKIMHHPKEGNVHWESRSLEHDSIRSVVGKNDNYDIAHSYRSTDLDHPSRARNLLPFNQCAVFSLEQSRMSRVEEWVNSIDIEDRDDLQEYGMIEPEGASSKEEIQRGPVALDSENAQEMEIVNNAIRSLNAFSTAVNIAGVGLSLIPSLGMFTSLRTLNLSGNFIVRLTPGSLPRSLHALNLSGNRISTIEGLRELSCLRVLDLSYNRISRIGHGLADCTSLKELYIAGNKISDIEGLHRLLKLTVLDLSFNRITISKSLGQLASNYSSLMAINLLGNPAQTNAGDKQLRKTLISLLPHLAYFNKQPIKNVFAREVVAGSFARAALGNTGCQSQHGGRPIYKVNQRGSRAIATHRSGASILQQGSRGSNGECQNQGREVRYEKSMSRQEYKISRRPPIPSFAGNPKLNNEMFYALHSQSMHPSRSEGALQDSKYD